MSALTSQVYLSGRGAVSGLLTGTALCRYVKFPDAILKMKPQKISYFTVATVHYRSAAQEKLF